MSNQLCKGWSPAAEDEIVGVEDNTIDNLYDLPRFTINNPPVPGSACNLGRDDYYNDTQIIDKCKEAFAEGYHLAMTHMVDTLKTKGFELSAITALKGMQIKLRRNGYILEAGSGR